MPIDKFRHPKTGVAGWRVRVSRTVNGKRERRQRFVFASIAVAREVEKELRDEVEAAAHGVKGATVSTIGEICSEYLKASTRKVSHNEDVSRLGKMLDHFGAGTPARDIRLADLESYRTRRLKEKSQSGKPIAPSTVNREMSALSVAFNFASAQGLLDPPYNPVSFLKKLPEASVRHVVPTDDQVVALCSGRAIHVRHAVLISRLTGLRAKAVLALDWSQFVEVFDSRGVAIGHIIYPTDALLRSNKRMGRVPVPTPLLAALGEKRKSGPVVTHEGAQIKSIRSALRRSRKSQGMMHVKFHDLRRAFHMDLLRAGIDPAIRRVMMGHGRDLRFATTVEEHYAAISDEDLLAAAAVLPDATDLVRRVLNAPPQNLGGSWGK